jgi:hypothetical protein
MQGSILVFKGKFFCDIYMDNFYMDYVMGNFFVVWLLITARQPVPTDWFIGDDQYALSL